jgi:predicted DsbA family dithiol-disulfide isomerase
MKIEIWSDVVCPWCYIGKRRLESALAAFPHRDDVEIVWHSFELDPTTVRVEGESTATRLARKIGVAEAQVAGMQRNVVEIAAGEGLAYDLDRALPTNTFDLHRVLHLAAEQGRADAVKEAFLAGYFVEGRDLADVDTVVEVASAAGLPEADVRRVLADPKAYARAVEDDRTDAAALGANGVPFFVFDRTYGISGAQPVEHFTAVLEKAWAETHPIEVLAPASGSDDASCADGSCAV